ncbi:hypothetical protein MRX96_030051 [Rhipicephalus microplus]
MASQFATRPLRIPAEARLFDRPIPQQRGLLHIDRIAHVPDGRLLLVHLQSRPARRMGELLKIYREAVGLVPPVMPIPPPREKPLAISPGLRGLSKRRSPHMCPPVGCREQPLELTLVFRERREYGAAGSKVAEPGKEECN